MCIVYSARIICFFLPSKLSRLTLYFFAIYEGHTDPALDFGKILESMKHNVLLSANKMKSASDTDKTLISMQNDATLRIYAVQACYNELTQLGRTDMTRQKRAIEILGSFLSMITGVPLARDHRVVLEQLVAITNENKVIEGLMDQQQRLFILCICMKMTCSN